MQEVRLHKLDDREQAVERRVRQDSIIQKLHAMFELVDGTEILFLMLRFMHRFVSSSGPCARSRATAGLHQSQHY